MKKLLTALILILGLTTIPIYAQDVSVDTATADEEEITVGDDKSTVTDEEMEEELEKQNEEGTLSEELEVNSTAKFGFWSILLAVTAPLLLIVIAYLVIKMSSK